MLKPRDKLFSYQALAVTFVLGLGGCGSTTSMQTAPPSNPTQTDYPSASTRQWLTELASTDAPPLIANQAGPPTDVLGAMAGNPTGGFVMAGYTLGTYPGFTNASGAAQAIVAKYDSSGVRQWFIQFGTGYGDFLNGIAVDVSENIYAAGATNGTYAGQVASPGEQALVVKLDKSGNRIWVTEFNLGSGYTSVNAVSVDSSGVPYVVGSFTPVATTGTVYSFAAQLDPASGSARWIQKYGAANIVTSIDALALGPAGDLYILGGNLTATSSGQSTANVERLSSSTGSLFWNQDLEAASKGTYLLSSVTVPADGQPIIAGSYSASNSLVVGFGADSSASGFIAKLSASSGLSSWQVRPSSGAGEEVTSVVATAGGIYAVGSTNGSLSGAYSAQLEGNFLLKLNNVGDVTWVQQFGTGRVVNIQTPYGLRSTTDGKSIYVGGPTQTAYPGFAGNGLLQIFLSSWGI